MGDWRLGRGTRGGAFPCPRLRPNLRSSTTLHRWLCLLLGWGLLWGATGCAQVDTANSVSSLQMVTVVVSSTPGPTQTPLVVTELQTVVVTATSGAAATAPAGGTAPPPPTRTTRATPPPASRPPESTPSPTLRALPTHTPPPAPRFTYEAPTLLEPSDGHVVFGNSPPTLRWEGPPLAEDEWYEVTIERLWQNQPYYAGSDWTKSTTLSVPTFVRGSSDTRHYTWWVTIKRLTGSNAAGGKVGEALSPPSQQRTFTWPEE